MFAKSYSIRSIDPDRRWQLEGSQAVDEWEGLGNHLPDLPARAPLQPDLPWCVATIPVNNVAAGARWYHDVLQLEYVREFRAGGAVFACGLDDQHAEHGVQLRLQDATPAQPDLRGVHPIVLRVAGSAELDAVFNRLNGTASHPLGGPLCWRFGGVLDPGAIVLRFMSDGRGGRHSSATSSKAKRWSTPMNSRPSTDLRSR